MSGYYTCAPNEFFDEILQDITSLPELKVTLAVIRRTRGFGKDSDIISRSQFKELTGLTSNDSITQGINSALDRGFVEREKQGHSYAYSLSLAPPVSGDPEDSTPPVSGDPEEHDPTGERWHGPPVSGDTKERERNTTNLSSSEEIRCKDHEESQGEDDVAEKIAPQLFDKLESKGWELDEAHTMQFFRSRKGRYSTEEMDSATSRMCVALATGFPIKTDHKRFFDSLLEKPTWQPVADGWSVEGPREPKPPVVGKPRTEEECMAPLNELRRMVTERMEASRNA